MIRAYYDAVDGLALATPRIVLRNQSNFRTSKALERMQKLPAVILIAALLTVVSGCVFRANISQGNLIEQDDLDQIEVGMTRNQIRFLLGTPMIDDPFHKDRWDYVYYLKISRKDTVAKRWVSILFSGDKVGEIRKDLELDPDL